MKKTRQLTYKDRVLIQNFLEDNIPISIICKKIGVSKQTIYREIKRNSIITKKDTSTQTLLIVRIDFHVIIFMILKRNVIIFAILNVIVI